VTVHQYAVCSSTTNASRSLPPLPRTLKTDSATSKNAFNCFSDVCKARGNVLDFVAAMEKCSIRDAALKLQEWFKVGKSVESERDRSDPLTTSNPIDSIRKLIDEIEGHNSQIAYLASMVQTKTAAVK